MEKNPVDATIANGEFTSRAAALAGAETVSALGRAKIAVFGVGGVGGWCAETLVRSGAGDVTIVDPDEVRPSNINRQTVATSLTVGMAKVDAFAKRLAEINPRARLRPVAARYCAETACSFDLGSFDYVIDAIDSVEDKALLVRSALASEKTTLFSSMGAALRFDPLRLRISPFGKVQGDALARALRHRLKKTGGVPERDFECVWSDEPPAACAGAERGSLMQVVAPFGCALASLVVNDLRRRAGGAK
jgi:tRNA A37 threonylcarbamoyladenosine dehydratase